LSEAADLAKGSVKKPKVSAAEQRVAQKNLSRIERRLGTVDKRIVELNKAAEKAGADTGKLIEIDAEIRKLTDEKDELEVEWMEAADAAE
jgi:ATP-binding cassette subfamily F protein uup